MCIIRTKVNVFLPPAQTNKIYVSHLSWFGEGVVGCGVWTDARRRELNSNKAESFWELEAESEAIVEPIEVTPHKVHHTSSHQLLFPAF
jgi:hypothetical protein